MNPEFQIPEIYQARRPQPLSLLYTVAVRRIVTHGHGDSGREEQILRMANGQFPPIFTDPSAAQAWLASNRREFHWTPVIVAIRPASP